MAHSEDFHAIIALGVVVAGDTSHHELIGQTTAKALLDISILTSTPVINGILVVNSEEQARIRIAGEHARGPEFAEAALHMANLKRNWENTGQCLREACKATLIQFLYMIEMNPPEEIVIQYECF